MDVTAARHSKTLTTTVNRRLTADLLLGHVLPNGAKVAKVTLDGRLTAYDVRQTARGHEVVVDAGKRPGTRKLVITLS